MINGVYKKEYGLSVKQWQDDVNKGVCVTWASPCAHTSAPNDLCGSLVCVYVCVYERLCLCYSFT